ncbi:hypothetical protein CHARACLAT_028835 [Characodon lateralis]|uniref:Uncharacterized protein n=1 Tax=Characodon lateralis TaxID=208331 RepID=A0ABU7DZ17_9TELE|nr:hypothetical protein [Characodon lateralis]
MKKIPNINATIIAANEKTRQAEEALGNAAADARDAKKKAEDAERIADNVQKVNQHILLIYEWFDPSYPTHCLFTLCPCRARLRPKRKQRRRCRTPTSWTKM